MLDSQQASVKLMQPVQFPVLLLPFLAGVVERRSDIHQISINANGVVLTVDATSLFVGHSQPSDDTSAALDKSWLTPSPCHWRAIQSADVSDAGGALPTSTRVPSKAASDIKRLQEFAALTYAPATEASRLSGAGAGLNDND